MAERKKVPLPPTLAKLREWEKAGPGRSVVKSVRKVGAKREHVVSCRINREIAALGVGDSPALAMRDACSKLWKASLAATASPTNEKPKWSRKKP